MKTSRALLFLISAALAAISMGGVQAAAPRLPATLYPAGARISYNPSLSNHSMDCMWGFVCEGYVPLFHTVTQDGLQRKAGWDQLASIPQRRGPRIVFWLFASRYAPASDDSAKPWSAWAFEDLHRQINAHGYARLGGSFHLLPPASLGASLAAREQTGGWDLVVMAAWSGDIEVESIVMYPHRSPIRAAVVASLARQVRAALAVGA
jgi:hypothetical protein